MKPARIILAAAFALMFTACGKGGEDEGTDNTPTSYCRFGAQSVDVGNQSGQSIFTIEWSRAKWTISTDPDGQTNFITAFSATKGGNSGLTESYTQITFTYPANPGTTSRTQTVYLTNDATGNKVSLAVVQAAGAPMGLTLDANTRYQTVTGFGGMLNPTWTAGDAVLTDANIEVLYNQLGYNLIRMMIYPTESYTGSTVSVWDRDVAIAKKAKSYGAQVLASPWTPPSSMKDNNSNIGGHLSESKYATYATYLNTFVTYMAGKGLTVDVVSVQNEPDWNASYDGCLWSGAQLLKFVKEQGATVKGTTGVKLLASESLNFTQSYTDPILNDATAAANLDICGGHLYGKAPQDYPLARTKGKEVWMTEHLENEESTRIWDKWDGAMWLADELHACMDKNFTGYIYWYLKRYYGMIGDNTTTGSSAGIAHNQVTKRAYVMAHYAKYATGRQRIKLTSTSTNLLATAYLGTNDMTVVLINKSAGTIAIPVPSSRDIVSATAIETTASVSMQNKSVTISSDKRSVDVSLLPSSIVSIKFTY